MHLSDAVSGIDHHLWSSEPDVAQFLACLVKMHRFTRVVEVGVFKGLTACHLIDSLGPGGRYLGIDIQDHRSESVKHYMSEASQSFLLADSRAALAGLPPHSADLIFLDGDHSLPYVRDEFMESLRILTPGGIICIHDYHSRGVRIWADYLRRHGSFEAMVFDTSERRGLVVVVPRKGERSAGLWFRLWFRVTRNDVTLRVLEKLQAMMAA